METTSPRHPSSFPTYARQPGCILAPERSDHLITASSLPDLVLEVFKKRLKRQRILPLETLCHFVLLYHEDAADLGQKQPSELRIGPCTGRFLRPQTGSTGRFGQSPAKGLENSSKKLGCSRKKVVSLPGKSTNCPNYTARAALRPSWKNPLNRYRAKRAFASSEGIKRK